MKIIKIFLVFLIIFWRQRSLSQDLPKANEDFATKNYVAAEAGYRTSSSDIEKKSVANYNLGNAIYKQNFAGEAKFAFSKAAVAAKNHPEKHNAYHNLGNSLMLEKKYDLAVEVYKNALRNNPEDEETRYNFALAKKKDKENPNKDKDKKKDKKEDKKDNKQE
ncbi:MAG: tetratricopeptide repeat protein, partial [Flavobacterium sp.]|nr:tetratricopeptide repeat protein [Flavobacterium sp.]